MPDTDSNIATRIEASNQVSSVVPVINPIVQSQSGGLKSYPTSEALDEIEASGVRGNSAMTLLKAMVKMLEGQLQVSEHRLSGLETRFESLQVLHKEKCEKVEVLQSELRNSGKLKLLQNVLLTAGGLSNGVAVKYLVEGKGGGFWVLLIVGTIFLFAGWLWPLGPRSK